LFSTVVSSVVTRGDLPRGLVPAHDLDTPYVPICASVAPGNRRRAIFRAFCRRDRGRRADSACCAV